MLNLQEHVERRRKKGVAPVTLKKEVATLRACWNWAAHGELVKGVFPGRGLRFPKEEEKEPFRTFAEIEAIIAAEKPDEARKEAPVEALYLTRPELEQFLAHVRQNATLPWVYPMVVFAAYTGARRSEMLRALASDVDLAGGTITIREKKRVVGKRSTRTAPHHPEAGRGHPGVARRAPGQPVAVLPGGAGDPEQDEAGRARRRSPRTRPTTISSGRWQARSGRRCGATTCCGIVHVRPGERGR